jgi:hypothetical protein
MNYKQSGIANCPRNAEPVLEQSMQGYSPRTISYYSAKDNIVLLCDVIRETVVFESVGDMVLMMRALGQDPEIRGPCQKPNGCIS